MIRIIKGAKGKRVLFFRLPVAIGGIFFPGLGSAWKFISRTWRIGIAFSLDPKGDLAARAGSWEGWCLAPSDDCTDTRSDPMADLDDFDRKILKILQRDASLPVAEVAERVGLSTTPCWRRIKRLEQEGVIVSRRAVLDPDAVGLSETVFVWVALGSQAPDARDRFKRDVSLIPEVVEAYYTAGNWDFLLKVMVPNMAAYDRLLRDRLYRIPGLEKVTSHIVLEPVKHPPELPL